MNIVPQEIESYVKAHMNPIPPLLEELERETYAKVPMPQMISGVVEGRILQMFIRAIHARRVLEVGTFTVFSGLMMAESLRWSGLSRPIYSKREIVNNTLQQLLIVDKGHSVYEPIQSS